MSTVSLYAVAYNSIWSVGLLPPRTSWLRASLAKAKEDGRREWGSGGFSGGGMEFWLIRAHTDWCYC